MNDYICWDVIANALKEEGVDYVFGIPGNPKALYNSLYDVKKPKAVLVRHETSGIFMAMAYSKISHRPSVCFGSPGPGVANLVPGVLEAESGCAPIVILGSSSNTATEGMGAFQEAPQLEMLRPITKWSYRLASADRASWAVRRAFSVAKNGKPGPVFIDVPFDVGLSKTSDVRYIPSEPPIRVRPQAEKVAEAANLILKSERPIIVAGGGASASMAHRELLQLAEMLGIPVFTTPCGRGVISENHPLALGLVGLYRTSVGRKVYQDSDLLISLGSRNEEFQTATWRYYPDDAKFIQVDIDPFEIGRNWVPDVAVISDVKLFLLDLISALKDRIVHKPLSEMPRVTEILEAKKAYEDEVESECLDCSKPIKSKRIIFEANRVFGSNTILVNENGSQDLWSYYYPYYKVYDLDGCVAPAEQTCMGFGVAGAIGAKLAAPDRKVICTTGDGAFQMFMKELSTAVQYKAPVTWIVLNNFSLGWIKLHQKALGERYISVDFESQPDFAKAAESFGCYGERVEDPESVKDSLIHAMIQNSQGVPAVLDFIVDPWDFPDGFKEFHTEIWKS
ncbi:thiamine pyrophosphate-binding protein [Candidatus Bathyarchaeota archaeon]|nr:thiamine pyrophosphate-binding protein [Candidatus Bathyarchaeota archaeon]MBS7631532.1 thiamine pyrophosphate-binding protein [Candidatus Bathyarchaeota archaeon]